jgi:hypothetical protein
MDINANDRQQSEFNMAVSYLSRLNVWLFQAGMASSKLDSNAWFHCLMVVFRELSTEMKDEELELWNNKVIEINNMMTRESMNNKRNRSNAMSPKLYSELHMFEIYLRSILKKSGLQTKMKDDFMKPEEQW